MVCWRRLSTWLTSAGFLLMRFFKKTRREAVDVPRGHLALVLDDGRVLDLGRVTEEDVRLLQALTESAYRHRLKGISEITLSRLRGLASHWYSVVKTPRK